MEEVKTSKTVIVGLIISTTALLMSVFALTINVEPFKSLINPDKVVEQHVQSDSDYVPETITIDEILQFRREVKEQRKYDSIFMNMPDAALIAILMKGGTDMSNGDIAKEYINNKKDYDNVEFGAQINAMHRQMTSPDTIQKKTEPDLSCDLLSF